MRARVPESIQDAPVAAFVAAPGGEALLTDPALQDIVQTFCAATSYPEHALRGRGLIKIGSGQFSHVWAFDDRVALKAHSPTTVRSAAAKVPKNDDLLNQHRFMRVLGRHLADRTDGEIFVPDQYFALRSQHGADLLAQQYMRGWQALDEWIDTNLPGRSELAHIFSTVRGRISKAVGHSSLRLGLRDLGLLPGQELHEWNVLVPRGTQAPEEARLCIIDQPLADRLGSLSTLAARIIDGRQDAPALAVPAAAETAGPTAQLA